MSHHHEPDFWYSPKLAWYNETSCFTICNTLWDFRGQGNDWFDSSTPNLALERMGLHLKGAVLQSWHPSIIFPKWTMVILILSRRSQSSKWEKRDWSEERRSDHFGEGFRLASGDERLIFGQLDLAVLQVRVDVFDEGVIRVTRREGQLTKRAAPSIVLLCRLHPQVDGRPGLSMFSA